MFFLILSCKKIKEIKSFPFYQQTNETNCGPACLRMIFKYYGKTYTEQYLSEIAHVSDKGTTMLELFDAAESLGFKPEGWETDFQNLSENINLPCIAYWKPNHFVVVYKIENSKIYVADPRDSLRVYDKNEFCNLWEDPKDNGEKTGYILTINK
jgi:ATP-binding cassette subfamily B protein